MLVAVAVLLASGASAAAVVVPVVAVPAQLPAVAAPGLLLLNLLRMPLPRVVVESEVHLPLQGRQSF